MREIDEARDEHDIDNEIDDIVSQEMQANTGVLGGKGRRPNVVISEKKVSNAGIGPSELKAANANNNGDHKRMIEKGRVMSRQAAVEEEHTVVRGTQGGKTITRITVTNTNFNNTSVSPFSFEKGVASEHHCDPSDSNI